MRLADEAVALLRLLADREEGDRSGRRRPGSPRRRRSPCARTGGGAPGERRRSRPRRSARTCRRWTGAARRSPAGGRRGAGGSRAGRPRASRPCSRPRRPRRRSLAHGAAGGEHRALALVARRVGGLLVHRDDVVGVDDLEALGERLELSRRPEEDGFDAVRWTRPSAPATISSGARSPPIASTATRICGIAREAGSRAARPHGRGRCRRSGRRDEAAWADGTAGTRRAPASRACASRAACRGATWTFFAWGLPWPRLSIARATSLSLSFGELRPARLVAAFVLVLVRLDVQVAAADRARGRRSPRGRGSCPGARARRRRAPRRRGRGDRPRRGRASGAPRLLRGSSPGTRGRDAATETRVAEAAHARPDERARRTRARA